jgi:hypothetical protein
MLLCRKPNALWDRYWSAGSGAAPSRKARPDSIPARVAPTVGGPNCKQERCRPQGSRGRTAAPRRSAKASSRSACKRRGRTAAVDHPRRIRRRNRRARRYLALLCGTGPTWPVSRTTREVRHGSPEDLLNTAEVAQIMRSPVSTLRYWRHLGTGPHSFRLGSRVVYRRADVTAWLLEQAAAGRAERAG